MREEGGNRWRANIYICSHPLSSFSFSLHMNMKGERTWGKGKRRRSKRGNEGKEGCEGQEGIG